MTNGLTGLRARTLLYRGAMNQSN